MPGLNYKLAHRSPYSVEKFKAHHRDNPKIYEMFCRFALEAAARRDYFSARAVFERMRWETMMTEKTNSGFKLANGWIAHYARLFMKDYPQYPNFFRTITYPGGVHDHID